MTAPENVVLGIELGSTRIKACLVAADDPSRVLATGGHEWENRLVDGLWTYSLDEVWSGLQAAWADLAADAKHEVGVQIARRGVSDVLVGAIL